MRYLSKNFLLPMRIQILRVIGWLEIIAHENLHYLLNHSSFFIFKCSQLYQEVDVLSGYIQLQLTETIHFYVMAIALPSARRGKRVPTQREWFVPHLITLSTISITAAEFKQVVSNCNPSLTNSHGLNPCSNTNMGLSALKKKVCMFTYMQMYLQMVSLFSIKNYHFQGLYHIYNQELRYTYH